jgi:hypothetical protein
MRRLSRDEIVPPALYGAVRDDYRRAVIAHKRTRRLSVGPSVTLLFEDRETLRFQVQEMLWVERIERPEAIQNELDVYNELMPGARELSATLFVEITEPGRIRPELDRLIGIDEHVSLVLGAADAERRVAARFDEKQFEEERISAVQYIRFALDADEAATLADAKRYAAVRIPHPAYRHEVELRPEIRTSLAAGLESEPASLMPPLPVEDDAVPEVLFENAVVRVRRAAPPDPPGSLIVEAIAPLASDDEPDVAAWGAVLEAVRRAVSDTLAQTGGCRVLADLTPGSPPRWRVLPQRD